MRRGALLAATLLCVAAPIARAQDVAPLAPPPLAPPTAPTPGGATPETPRPPLVPPLGPAQSAPLAVPTQAPLAVPMQPPPAVPAQAPLAVPTQTPLAVPTQAQLAVPTSMPAPTPSPIVSAPEEPPAPPVIWPDDRVGETRFVLGGVASGIAWGGGVSFRADIGLLSIGERSAIAIGADVMAIASWLPFSSSGLVGFQPIVAATASWRLRIHRVELAVRGGVAAAFPYESLSSNGDWRFGFALRGLVGAQMYWRAAPSLQLLAGLDAQFGTGELVTLTIGVRL